MNSTPQSYNITRYIANTGLLIGQGILLYNDIRVGIIIKIISGLIILYHMTILKLWDMVIVICAFLILDLSKLIHLTLSIK